MKRFFILVGVCLCSAASVWGQYLGSSGSEPPAGTISSNPTNGIGYRTVPGVIPNTNNANSNLTLTNNLGGAFSVEQLGSQLQTLRATVEQTLPLLSAFNQRYSAAQPGTTLGRAVQNILSENKNQQSGSTAGREITNVLAALGALVSTNNNQSVSASTLQDLATLQKDLQPVEQLLQNLNFTARPTNRVFTPGVPSPTGR